MPPAKRAARPKSTRAVKATRVTPQSAALGYAAEKGSAAARNAGRTAAQARAVPGDRRYQGVILAEFLLAVVVIAGLPIMSGGSPNAKAKGGPSPYDSHDMIQLVAVGGVYFILALVSSGNRGRIAAWFGGLVLIGLGFTKIDHIKALVPQKSEQASAAQ